MAEVWNIGHAKQILSKICHGILVIHAFSGCDTTSRIHSAGRPAILEKYWKSNQFQKLTTIFLDLSANKGNIWGTTYAFHNWSHKEREDNG